MDALVRRMVVPALMVLCAGFAFGRPPSIGIYAQFGDELRLSADQQAQVRSAEAALRKRVIMKEAETRVAEIELDELLDKESPDMAEVEAAVRKIVELRSQAELALLTASLHIQEVLGRDQVAMARAIEERQRRQIQDRAVEAERLAADNRRLSEEIARAEQTIAALRMENDRLRDAVEAQKRAPAGPR